MPDATLVDRADPRHTHSLGVCLQGSRTPYLPLPTGKGTSRVQSDDRAHGEARAEPSPARDERPIHATNFAPQLSCDPQLAQLRSASRSRPGGPPSARPGPPRCPPRWRARPCRAPARRSRAGAGRGRAASGRAPRRRRRSRRADLLQLGAQDGVGAVVVDDGRHVEPLPGVRPQRGDRVHRAAVGLQAPDGPLRAGHRGARRGGQAVADRAAGEGEPVVAGRAGRRRGQPDARTCWPRRRRPRPPGSSAPTTAAAFAARQRPGGQLGPRGGRERRPACRRATRSASSSSRRRRLAVLRRARAPWRRRGRGRRACRGRRRRPPGHGRRRRTRWRTPASWCSACSTT